MIKSNDISERLRFLGLDKEARYILRELKPVLEAEIPRMLERFYDHIAAWPQVNALFESESSKVRVRQRQAEHLGKLLAAEFGDEFIQDVERAGKTHYRIGLRPRWYIDAYAHLIGELLTAVCRKFSDGITPEQSDQRDKAVIVLVRAALLDMELAISVSLEEGDEAIKKEMDEHRRTEMKLTNEASDLETALGESETFSYAVSHDLRAPLRSIDGFSQALEEDYADKIDETGKDFLRRIRRGAAKMEQLINDLLKLSQINRVSISPAKVDLSAMAHEIVEALKEDDPERDVEVKIEPHLSEECDPHLMNIVLTNLLENAWKYTRMQPQARIEFGQERQNGKTTYFIRDNGIGFDMAYADKLFKPFQRLHSSQDFPGTGIGLATVARIIQRHGGHIAVQSEPGKGTAFNFVISDHSYEGASHGGHRPNSPG